MKIEIASVDKAARRVALYGAAIAAASLLHFKLVTEPTVRLVAEERAARVAADSLLIAQVNEVKDGAVLAEMDAKITKLRRQLAELQRDVESVQYQGSAILRQGSSLQTKTDVIVQQTKGLKKPPSRWDHR